MLRARTAPRVRGCCPRETARGPSHRSRVSPVRFLVFLFLTLSSTAAFAEPKLLPMRERAEEIDRWLEERVKTLLPELMRREGIDMWVLISREYNEDPVLETFLPAKRQSARRRTILLIYDPGKDKTLETLAIARYDVGKVFKKAWDKEKHASQWQRLISLKHGLLHRALRRVRHPFLGSRGSRSARRGCLLRRQDRDLHRRPPAGDLHDPARARSRLTSAIRSGTWNG